jgi:hypothetical protein
MISVEELPQFAASIDEVIEEKQDTNHRFAGIIVRAEAEAEAKHVKLITHITTGHAVSSIHQSDRASSLRSSDSRLRA